MKLLDAFKNIGAAAVIERRSIPSRSVVDTPVTVDVQKGKFIINLFGSDDSDISILDMKPKSRHLLMMIRNAKNNTKCVCGHDETQWYTAAVGNKVSTVQAALESLKPDVVRRFQIGIRSNKKANTHKNRSSIGKIPRQGEWFFIPQPNTVVDPMYILKNEPLQRNMQSKPHRCEELYRSGGSTVYVYGHQTITERDYKQLNPANKKLPWRSMRANASILVRGAIKHPDHSTVHLMCWHKVELNNEVVGSSAIRYLD